MSRLAPSEVQAAVHTLIAAWAYFAGETVILWRGKEQTEKETALSSKGQVILILPIAGTDNAKNSRTAVIANAQGIIHLLCNPLSATKDIEDMAEECVKALKGYNEGIVNDGFNVPEGGQSTIFETPEGGLWEAFIGYEKPCVIETT